MTNWDELVAITCRNVGIVDDRATREICANFAGCLAGLRSKDAAFSARGVQRCLMLAVGGHSAYHEAIKDRMKKD